MPCRMTGFSCCPLGCPTTPTGKRASRTTTPPTCANTSPASQVGTSVEGKETIDRQTTLHMQVVLKKKKSCKDRVSVSPLFTLTNHRYPSPSLTFAQLIPAVWPTCVELCSDVCPAGLMQVSTLSFDVGLHIYT